METKYFILLIYIIGVIASWLFQNKQYNIYNKEHPNELNGVDKKYIEKLMICVSLMSWIAFFAFLAGGFCSLNDRNGDDEDDN